MVVKPVGDGVFAQGCVVSVIDEDVGAAAGVVGVRCGLSQDIASTLQMIVVDVVIIVIVVVVDADVNELRRR